MLLQLWGLGARARIVLGTAAVAALSAVPAGAATLNVPANPVSRVVTIQPIIVCSTDGSVCANKSGLLAYETMANVIYNQAGIGAAFATPNYYYDSTYLNPQVDTTANALFDNAHDLVRVPGHGQATDPNTLNVFLVDTLVSVSTGANNTLVYNPTVHSYGYGLIGGNGAVIATTPDSLNRVAAPDTLAHEVGHNLGLQHTDSISGSQYSLMNSGSRVVATDPCQVTPYTCAVTGVARDTFYPSQQTTLSSPPILTELPKVTAVQSQADGPRVNGDGPRIGLTGPTPSSLNLVKYRFSYGPTTVQDFSTPGATVTRVAVGTHVEYDVKPAAPLVYSPTNNPGLFDKAYGQGGVGARPYSSEYDFGNGLTSRTAFDLTGINSAPSEFGAVLGFDPNAPDVVHGPSYLPSDIGAISPLTGQPVSPEIDTASVDPGVLDNIPYPFAAADGFVPAFPDPPGPPTTAVPEPGTLVVFGSALAGLGLLLRRRRRRRRRAA